MGKVIVAASVSLDGYIAGPDETGFEHLFAWYEAGDVEFPSAHPSVRLSLTPGDHAYVKALAERVGALVVGRRLFDLVDGWGGTHAFEPAAPGPVRLDGREVIEGTHVTHLRYTVRKEA